MIGVIWTSGLTLVLVVYLLLAVFVLRMTDPFGIGCALCGITFCVQSLRRTIRGLS